MKRPRSAICSDCGHTAPQHRQGRSACRAVIQSKWQGATPEARPPGRPDAVYTWYGWECGCKRTRTEIEATLGAVCQRCNGTGFEPKATVAS